jgi:hypothetical protein
MRIAEMGRSMLRPYKELYQRGSAFFAATTAKAVDC